MKLIHLTDTHLVKKGEKLFDLDPYERLTTAIKSINNNHSDAELCVITGDLAHKGEKEAYSALNEALSRLSVPYKLVVGNHDFREAVIHQFPSITQDSNGYLQSRFETSAGQFILLDTVKAGTHEGEFCQRRRSWLKNQLQQCEDQDVFLFAHHPPFWTGLPTMDKISIGGEDARALGALLADHPNIRHLFFGHLHRPLSGSWKGISFSSLRSTNHQVWLDFSAQDVIPGSHEPPAYSIALIDPDQIVIHTHDFMDTSRKFDMGSLNWKDWQ